MSEGWGEPAESAGEEREGNEGSWNDDKNGEGEKTGEGWEVNENEEKGSGVGGNEEGDEEVVPAADREGGEGTGHGEGELDNREGWGETGQKESAGTMESGKGGGGSGEEGEDENVKRGAPPEVNQMHTLKVDNLPYRVEASELREEFERFVRDSGGGGGVWGEDKGDGGGVVGGVKEEYERRRIAFALFGKEVEFPVQHCRNPNPYVSFNPVMMIRVLFCHDGVSREIDYIWEWNLSRGH